MRSQPEAKSTDEPCTVCHGTGAPVVMRLARFGQPLPPYKACAVCKGTGVSPPSDRAPPTSP